MAEKYKELISLTKEELIERHDQGVRYVQVGISHYLQELRHREILEALEVIAGYCRREWDMQHKTGRFKDGPPESGKVDR